MAPAKRRLIGDANDARGDDDADASTVAVAEGGLRARVHKRKSQADDHVEFGVAQANAYINATRIKQKKPAAGAAKRTNAHKKPRSNTDNNSGGCDDKFDQQDDDKDDSELLLPSRGVVLAALKIADEREAARRAAHPKHALPTFDQHFPLWRSQLLARQNLLFYGMGSKLALLQRFADEWLSDALVLQLHGYLPAVSMRYVTQFLHTEVLRVRMRASRSLVQQDIVTFATTRSPQQHELLRVTLVVHSIDGLAMRTPEFQTCLSYLATAPFITLVASMDQINAASMWKEDDALRFHWVTQALHTCVPYTDELDLRLSKQSTAADQSSNGVKFILQSLTPVDVATLRIIAQLQLAASAADLGGGGGGGSGTTSSSQTTNAMRRKTKAKAPVCADYQRVFDVCRKRLLHATLLAMKNSIKCLVEHGLVRLVRVRNTEKLEIPLPEHIVKSEILQIGVGTTAKAKTKD